MPKLVFLLNEADILLQYQNNPLGSNKKHNYYHPTIACHRIRTLRELRTLSTIAVNENKITFYYY